jgi:multiple RNA-binding domain-containing protein 1
VGGVPSAAAPGAARRAAAGDAADTSSEGGGESESEDLYEDIGARAPRGGGAPGGANAGEEEEEEEQEDAVAVAAARTKTKGAKAKEAAAAVPAADAPHLSDLDYLRSRVRANFSDDEEKEGADAADEEEEEEEEDDDEDAADGADADAEVLPDADGGAPGSAKAVYATPEGDAPLSSTGRIFARNLPFTATEEELRELFSEHGELMSVHVVTDKASGRSKGLAYVQFAIPACAVEAMAQLDGCVFQGRLLHLLPAARLPGSEGGDAAGGVGDKATAFKAAKEAQLKARGAMHTHLHLLHTHTTHPHACS